MQRDPTTCGKVTTPPGYDESRYNFTCNVSTFTFKLRISNLMSNESGCWNCSVSFSDTFPTNQASTCLSVTSSTTTPATNTTTGTTTKETVTSTSSPSTSMSSTTIKAIINSTSASSTATDSVATVSINTSASTNSATGSAATVSINTSTPRNSATPSVASASNSTSTSKSPTGGSTANATISTSTPTNPKTIGSAASASSNTSTSTSPTAGSTANATISTSTPTNTVTKSSSSQGGADTKVIVLAVVVPIGGLLLIGVIILLVVLCIRHRRAGKNGCEIPDGMAAQDIGNNVDGWEQSFRHDRTAKHPNAIQTPSDGFIIYPGPAAMSTARPNKQKKYPDVAYQYETPYPGTYGYQTAYVPSTYTYDRSSTHKGKKHHNVGHSYSRPYTGTYGYQAAYGPSTYMSARTYSPKSKSYDYESPYGIAASRPAYDQTAYYPQTGYYGKISQDVYYKGGGHDSYGQRSRPHLDRSGRKQQREYYNQYEMADYGRSRTQYGQTKHYGQNTAIFY